MGSFVPSRWRFALRSVAMAFVALIAAYAFPGEAWVMSTVAGGNLGEGCDVSVAQINRPWGISADAVGNLYLADSYNLRIRKITPAGIITTIAGTNIMGWSGDDGPAIAARITLPHSATVDPNGNVYVADQLNNIIRKIDTAGIIHLVAGNGTAGFSGDSGSAVLAQLNNPLCAVADATGNLYIADSSNQRIRKVDFATGKISTVAGTGIAGYSGDTGQATAAKLNNPCYLLLDNDGHLLIADGSNQVVRKIDKDTQVITTLVSGNGNDVNGLAMNASGDLFVSDTLRVRKRTAAGVVSNVAGNGSRASTGASGVATAVSVEPSGVAVTSAGLFICEFNPSRIRKVDDLGTISTVAGGVSGDGGPAIGAHLIRPSGIARDSGGNVLFTDRFGFCVGRISTATWTIDRAAGSGGYGYSGDTGAATAAQLRELRGVAVAADGTFYISDTENTRIRKVNGTTGIITTLGTAGYTTGCAVDSNGNVYAVDHLSNKVWKVSASGVTTTFAGNGPPGYGGDDGPAASASLNTPQGVAVDASDNVYISDTLNHVIRKVDATTGVITTIVGNHIAGFSGDGGPALSAKLNCPLGVAIDAAGEIFIADRENYRIRKVGTDGIIVTIAGSDQRGFTDAIGSALGQMLQYPWGVAVNPAGTELFVADYEAQRIKRLEKHSAPVAAIGTLATNEDTPAIGTLSATDADGDVLTYAIAANGSKGTAVVTNAATGAYTYMPNLNANGTDTFTFKANDGNFDSIPATITVTINPVNDAPVAGADSYFAFKNAALTIAAPGVLANDSDVDGDPLTAVLDTGVTHGTLALNANGSFNYTPVADYLGPDSFTYHADDGQGGVSESVTVSVTVVNAPPVNTVAPAVTGTFAIGQALATDDGTWTDADGDGRTYTYQWQRADNGAGLNAADIGGATANTYTLATPEAHKYVRVTVTANDGHGGTTPASSAWTLVGNSTPVNTLLPAVTGTYAVGQALATDDGTWTDADGDARTYTYQWQRADNGAGLNAADIGGATAVTYTLAATEAHKYVRVTVTANDGHGGATPASSAWTLVGNTAPVNTVAPAITGTYTVGQALTTDDGTWTDADGDARTYTYQWQRADNGAGLNAADVGGATANSCTLATTEAHKYVRVTVTANDGHGGTTPASSAWTLVGNTAPVNTAVPVVTGTYVVGQALTTTNGTWTEADADTLAFSYQWLRANDASGAGAVPIGGATNSSYTLSDADAMKFVCVRIGADDGHGGSGTGQSAYSQVQKRNQTITFGALPIKVCGQADFDPGATASSGLAVTCSSSDLTVATIVAGKIRIVGAGTATITASQAGDGTWSAAPDVAQTLTVLASLAVTSGPTAAPNPATVGEPVQFACAASLPGTVFQWDFGDGAIATSGNATTTHAYAAASGAAGYVVTVTLVNGTQTVTGTLNVVVNSADTGGGGSRPGDADGDGFADSIEAAAGTNPNDAGSTPFGGQPAGAPLPLNITKIGIKLNFAADGRDGITLSGTFDLPAGFTMLDQQVVVDIGGVARAFVLSARGTARSEAASLKIAAKAKKGVLNAAQTAKFQVKMAGSFAEELADEGLTGDANVANVSKTIVVTLLLNQTVLQKSQAVHYSARAGQTGKAR